MSFSSSLSPFIAASGFSSSSLRFDASVSECRNLLSRRPRALRSRSKTYFIEPKSGTDHVFQPLATDEKRGLSLIFGSFEKRDGHCGGHRQVVVLVHLL